MSDMYTVGQLVGALDIMEKAAAEGATELTYSDNMDMDQLAEYVGNEIIREMDKHAAPLRDIVKDWSTGFSRKLDELGVDKEAFVKTAQAADTTRWPLNRMPQGMYGAARMATQPAPAGRPIANTSSLIQGALGDGLLGNAADLGSYFIPVVGDVRMGMDAVSDIGSMMGSGLNWKQRLGYGLSGLSNAAFSALGLASNVVPGVGQAASSGITGIGKLVQKALAGLKGVKGMDKLTKGYGALKGTRAGQAMAQGYGGLKRMHQAGGEAIRGAQHSGQWYSKPLQYALAGTKGGVMQPGKWAGRGADVARMGTGVGGMMAGAALQQSGVPPQQNIQDIQGGDTTRNRMGHPLSNPNARSATPYYGSQNSAQNFRGSSLGSGVSPLSRFSAGQAF